MKPTASQAASTAWSSLSVSGLALLLWVGWVLSAMPAWAQQGVDAREEPDPGPDWFQVELVIFARPDGASQGEKWPRDLELRYPFNWVELKDPEAPKSWLPDWLEKPINPGLVGAPGLEAPDEPRWTPLQVDLDRRPYFRLDVKARSLNTIANALKRNSEYRLLFHQAWRQPLVENQNNPAILIAGGDQFGSHRELAGSITLSLSRYLHLRTNLWLTEFEPNFGQPPEGWPQLPPAPDRPENGRPASAWSIDPATFTEAATRGGSAWDRFTQTAEPQSWAPNLPGFLQEDYLPERIVAMNQQRRMRSEELHYLDHPLFGIIVEIKPYERPKADSEDESAPQEGD